MSETNHIPARIKQARRMAGLTTQAALVQCIPGWKPSRLGNYEAGVSTPSPDDVLQIAKATDVSPCWLMFGLGPIRPSSRDLQAIRHQNLSRLIEQYGLTECAEQLGIEASSLQEYWDNPFQPIDDDWARQCEQIGQHTTGWMDEQHIEDDPLCMAFPEDIRELMMLYSDLAAHQRSIVLTTIKALVKALEVGR